jgi:hypothetical protein
MGSNNRVDLLKNLFKATRFNPYSHDCISYVQFILNKGWLAIFRDYKESLENLFQHIRPVNNGEIWVK